MTGHSLCPGDRIRLGCGNRTQILNGSKRIISDMRCKSIESLFVYSNMSLITLLKEQINYLIDFLAASAPVFGFYSDILFSNNNNENIFHTQSIKILALSEDESVSLDLEGDSLNFSTLFNSKEEAVFHHLIITTGDELTELNQNLERKIKLRTKDLEESYYTNKLTGLPNLVRLNEDIAQMKVNMLCEIEIDSFNDIRNFYGFPIADKLLKDIGKRIKAEGKSLSLSYNKIYDHVFGITGDDKISPEAFRRTHQSVIQRIESDPYDVQGHKISLKTISCIVMNENHILSKAGLVLENAKREEIPFQTYSEVLNLENDMKQNLRMATEIRNAIRDNRFGPYFKPIVNNSLNQIVKNESLIRMIDGKGLAISPGFFSMLRLQQDNIRSSAES